MDLMLLVLIAMSALAFFSTVFGKPLIEADLDSPEQLIQA